MSVLFSAGAGTVDNTSLLPVRKRHSTVEACRRVHLPSTDAVIISEEMPR
jgi:hypothetical protein